MARLSRDTDQLLIRAAQQLLPRAGCSGLSLRDVARLAQVNLGMFHYHFKTKKVFIRRVLQATYEEFFAQFSLEVGDDGCPLERLERALVHIGIFSRDHRVLMVSLVRDVLNGDREVAKFLKQNFGRHVQVLLRLVRECQKEGKIRDLSVPLIFIHFAGAVALPALLVEFLGRTGVRNPLGFVLPLLTKKVLDDREIKARVKFAIRAVHAGTIDK